MDFDIYVKICMKIIYFMREVLKLKEFISIFFVCLVICFISIFIYLTFISNNIWTIIFFIAFVLAVFMTVFIKQVFRIEELEKKMEELLNNKQN